MIAWLKNIWNSTESLISFGFWAQMVAALGAVLTLAGTVVAVVLTFRKDRLDRAHELESEAFIARTNEIAASANLRAGQAHERAASLEVAASQAQADAAEAVKGQKKLEVEAEQARTRQKELEAQTALARKEQEELRKQNLVLQSQVAREQAERLRLQQQVGHRVITADQESRIVATLRPHIGSKVVIRAPNSSPESTQFAERIRDIFIIAGWDAVPVFYNIMLGNSPPSGVTIGVTNTSSAIGIAVQRVFESVGIRVGGSVDQGIPLDTVIMEVGQKPQ